MMLQLKFDKKIINFTYKNASKAFSFIIGFELSK